MGHGSWPVAVVLGARVAADGRPSRALCRRVDHAVLLYRTGQVGRLLLTGGAVAHVRSEAEVMADRARGAGVPDHALILEPEARNTLENARHALALMERCGLSRALVVTDAYHLPRALYTFRRLGAVVEGRAPPVQPGLELMVAWAREIPARLVYVARLRRLVRRPQA